jgi:hypothetical protein
METPTAVRVAVLYPLTLTENIPRCDLYEMEVAPLENVLFFKQRLSALCGVPVDRLTLCVKGQLRPDDCPVSEEEFKAPEGYDHLVLHVRVEDPELNLKVAERLARGDMFIPLDEVQLKGAA